LDSLTSRAELDGQMKSKWLEICFIGNPTS